ncbi:hypothetical protein [Polaromonas sp. CG9_12]|nr:hypothetical protein [Polaromonas sp. CG9_12]
MTNSKQTRKTEVAPAPAPLAVTQFSKDEPDSDAVLHSELITSGDFASIAIVNSYIGTTTTDPGTILEGLHEQAKAIHQGDMRPVESMLMGQAVALQSMFSDFALRAKSAQSLQAVQCLAQLALRAQAGCRSTLQTLADVKNPRQVAFVKQTNVAQMQQVNNGTLPPSRVENIQAAPIELLVGEPYGRTKMDTRATRAAGPADSGIVTVGKVNRTAKRRR